MEGQGVAPSLVDHFYTNISESLTPPPLICVGDSNHLGLYVCKLTRNQVTKSRVIKKRLYKILHLKLYGWTSWTAKWWARSKLLWMWMRQMRYT